MSSPRLLIAGIGNIFLGDDAFGVEVVKALRKRPLSSEVRVVDFGIRGLDLAYELVMGYETVLMVDAAVRGGAPGTLYVIEPDIPAGNAAVETHSINPVSVLSVARNLGGSLPRVLLVGCEPEQVEHAIDPCAGMSLRVRDAVEPAITLIQSLIPRILGGGPLSSVNPPMGVEHA